MPNKMEPVLRSGSEGDEVLIYKEHSRIIDKKLHLCQYDMVHRTYPTRRSRGTSQEVHA